MEGIFRNEIYLRNWLFIVSGLSFFGSFLAFFVPNKLREQQYPNSAEVTRLMTRTYGAWTFVASCVRLQYALNLHVRPLYELTVVTFAVAIALFTSEVLYFKTMPVKKSIYPFAVAGLSSFWLLTYPPSLS